MPDVAHTLWIGGPSGAGKSTVARQLARRWGLRLYACDTRTWEHRDRAIAAGLEPAIRWEAMTPAGRAGLSAAEHRALEVIPARQAMVIEDLLALPRSPLVLAEGTLLPPHLADPSQSVWLVPSRDFQARHRDEPERRTEPMDVVIATAHARGIPIVDVDGSRHVAELVSEIEIRWADSLRAGPTSANVAERRAVLREANLDVVRQIRAGCARPWATADPEVQVRTFTCECGGETCDADVDATVGVVAAGPVLECGHSPT